MDGRLTLTAVRSRARWTRTIIRIMEPKHPNLEFVDNLRAIIRRHQLRLIADPDASDEWWFLVDPDATNAPEGSAAGVGAAGVSLGSGRRRWWPAGRVGGPIGPCIDPGQHLGYGHSCSVAAASIECPTCGAFAGYRCVTRGGQVGITHVQRSRGADAARSVL